MTNPIRIVYHENGVIFCKMWENKNGHFHREDGPAYISYYPDGTIHVEEWNINGVPHRINGPSKILYYQNSKIIEWNWFYKGIHYTTKVENWLENNDINYKKMTENDYNRMWFEIL